MASVAVIKKAGRKYLVMRHRDARTGREIEKSTGTNSKEKAQRIAGKWQAEIERTGRAVGRATPWEAFRSRWEDDREPTLRSSTAATYAATWSLFESMTSPKTVSDLSTEGVERFVAKLRSDGRSEATIGRHLRTLKVFARWANDRGLIASVPIFSMPSGKETANAKGRPLTLDEFEAMLEAVPLVVQRADAVDDWRIFLQGLYWSGLRLGEGLAIRWDHQRGGASVEIKESEDSTLRFDAEAQKNGKQQTVPLAYEAADLLKPLRRSRGYVFELGGYSRGKNEVCRRISAIGAAAGVVTVKETGQTATAHDLRRSFGERWAGRVGPADLQVLMRHSAIATTMTYYVDSQASGRAASINARGKAAAESAAAVEAASL